MLSQIVYPSTADALEKINDYRQNFMNLSIPESKWWHQYFFDRYFNIKVTWGKNNYFFAYAIWSHGLQFADPDEIGWGTGQIKPYKAWIFLYHPDIPLWETIYDADSLLWSEEQFIDQKRIIKAMH